MKPRKWVIVACLIVLVVAVTVYQGVSRLEKSAGIATVITDHLSRAIGGTFEVGRIRFGLFSVYLRDVKASVPVSAFTIEVKDIKVGFSLHKLIAARGDFASSISKIIFIEPRLSLMIGSGNEGAPSGPSAAADNGRAPGFSLRTFPAGYLLIKHGTAGLIQADGSETVVGEALGGRMWETGEGLLFELRGCLASRRRNLSLSGIIAGDGLRNRLSLRFDNARVSKPFTHGGYTIREGTLDGACEFTFGDDFSLRTVESNGWIRFDGGELNVRGIDRPLYVTTLSVSMNGSAWSVDSATGEWSGVAAHGRGAWDMSGAEESAMMLYAENIDIERLFPDAPPLVSKNLFGTGWLSAVVKKAPGDSAFAARLSGGGVSVIGKPLTRFVAGATVGRTRARIDSCILENAALNVRASGSLDWSDSIPSYRIELSCALDSIPTADDLRGSFRARGHVRGNGGAPCFEFAVSGRDVALFGFPVGNHRMSVVKNGEQVRFSTPVSGDDDFQVAGTIDSIASGNPHIGGSLVIGTRPLREFCARQAIFPAERIDAARLEADITGTPAMWNVDAHCAVESPPLRGGIALTLDYGNETTRRIRWRLREKDLLLSDSACTISGSGYAYADSIVVDSAFLFGGISASGAFSTIAAGQIGFQVHYDNVSLAALNRWFFDKSLPVESGLLSGTTRISGTRAALETGTRMRLRRCSLAGLSALETDAVVTSRGPRWNVLPFVVRKNGAIVISVDTLDSRNGITIAGGFEDIDLHSFLGPLLADDDFDISGRISGAFASSDSGFPIRLDARAPAIAFDSFVTDSLRVRADLDSSGVILHEFSARDGYRSRIYGRGVIPWSFFGDEVPDQDSLFIDFRMVGDLLATLEKNAGPELGGTGNGTIDVAFRASNEGWEISSVEARIERGELKVFPYIPSNIGNFSMHMTMDDSSRVNTRMNGMIRRKKARIYSTHRIPDGYEPLMIGPVNFGILYVETPDGPIELHRPGFQEPGEIGEVLFAGNPPFKAFALSGPVDRFKLTGTLFLGSAGFTYPRVDAGEPVEGFDPYPYITWELDLKPGNRNLMYFYDLKGRKRKLIRFVEAYIDPITTVSLRGRSMDNTFHVLGTLRSYKGSVFFGRNFDRRFEIGLDFLPEPLPGGGYNNMPVMWGSAEAVSDTSRFDRIKLTLQIQDPETAGLSEYGRAAMLPKASGTRRSARSGKEESDSIVNFIFSVSSDVEVFAGESERDFYREAGIRFSTFEGVGQFVSDMGEQYLHRYFLQRFERRLAKRLGLDVISFETSIASNYFNRFYNRQFSEMTGLWSQMALAHLGLTVGRYFFDDYLFLKARGELIPIDEFVRPEYSIGFEFQPVRYFMMDVNYGVHRGETSIEHDPRVNLQLRLPITRLRNFFNF